MPQQPLRRPSLRPRAGLPATALLIAGLAGAGAVILGAEVVEPARAQSAARIDPPAAAMPDTAHTEPSRPSGH